MNHCYLSCSRTGKKVVWFPSLQVMNYGDFQGHLTHKFMIVAYATISGYFLFIFGVRPLMSPLLASWWLIWTYFSLFLLMNELNLIKMKEDKTKHRLQLFTETITLMTSTIVFSKLIILNHYRRWNVPIKLFCGYLYSATLDPLIIGSSYYITRRHEHQPLQTIY